MAALQARKKDSRRTGRRMTGSRSSRHRSPEKRIVMTYSVDQHAAVRTLPGLQLVEQEGGGRHHGDGGARLHAAQAEADVRVILRQGWRNHPPRYRHAGRSAAIQRTEVAATLDWAMKTEIHPEYVEAHVRCTCGNEFTTRSTQSEIHVEICSNCHPFYTGRQKLVDTGGRVERFKRRAAKRGARS